MALTTPHVFQRTRGAKRLQPPPLNRLTTATAPASRVGQLQPATPVLDGDFAPLYRTRNRPSTAPTASSTAPTANRKREGPGGRALEGNASADDGIPDNGSYPTSPFHLASTGSTSSNRPWARSALR
jgi:hypothetical protein